MDLYIIRHAQSANNALADERTRVCDPHLTELGRRQAELLAAHLATGRDLHPSRPWLTTPSTNSHGFGITRLYTSAMRRTLQTSWPVGRALGITPEVWVDIHEEGGIWLDHGPDAGGRRGHPGITCDELRTEFPGYIIPAEVTAAGWWHSDAPETREATQARATQVAATLRSRWMQDEKIAIISHGAFGADLLRALLGESTIQPISYHLDNTSISLLRFRPQGDLSVRYLNRLDHLPPELIT